MAVLSLLADPVGYRPCTTNDMHVDVPFREHWVRHFMHHFKMVMRLAVETYGPAAQPRADACHADLIARFQSILDHPHQYERLDLFVLDALRQDILLAHDLPDPFEGTKARENDATLPLYPGIVAELDSHTSPEEALLLAVEGVFTGNIFDLGAHASVDMFANESPDFLSIRDKFGGKRPWLIDHFDAFARRALAPRPGGGPAYRQAMLFCDNAGPDFLLGILPFCRLLGKAGTRVVIAANRLPALNDITVGEIRALLPRFQAIDPTLDALVRAGRILAVDSGNTIPLIDLREISDEVNRYAPDTDLLILEGMGRAVETNLEAEFTCDSLKLAMIKDKLVADRQGGKLFDTVCKFDRAVSPRR
jgi:damage-control phosphatase, subfamily II, stand-alone protein